jgi:hypothetical protein
MRKLAKYVLILAAAVVAAETLSVGFYELHEFRPYLASMRAIYSGMAPTDREPPRNVQDFVWKVEGVAINSLDARDLLAEVRHPMRMGEWHLHSAMWRLLLPLHFNMQERTAFYCHYLAYENGVGFSNASQFYFGKPPEQLSVDELAAIVAVSRAPRRNSPSRHPDRFQAVKKDVLDLYARAQ